MIKAFLVCMFVIFTIILVKGSRRVSAQIHTDNSLFDIFNILPVDNVDNMIMDNIVESLVDTSLDKAFDKTN